MTKKIIFGAILASAFMFVGCGGGSSSGSSTPAPAPVDPMTERNMINIVLHYPADICSSNYLQQELERQGGTNFIYRVENNNVNCATYGKPDGATATGNCRVDDMTSVSSSYNQYDTSCVVGYDLPIAQASSTIQEDIALEMSFALDAIE